MPNSTFACPNCQTVFAIEPGTERVSANCSHCSSFLEGFFFPAFTREAPTGPVATALVDHTEASCFYHAQKQAVGICDGCGRMICALCSIDMGSEHLCPNCISAGKKKGKIITLENSRTRYDNIALGLSLVGLIGLLPVCSFLAVVIAPITLFISFRNWNSPGSVLGVKRWRFVVAILISILELVVVAVFIAAWILGTRRFLL